MVACDYRSLRVTEEKQDQIEERAAQKLWQLTRSWQISMKKYSFSTIPKVGNRRDLTEARLHARILSMVWFSGAITVFAFKNVTKRRSDYEMVCSAAAHLFIMATAGTEVKSACMILTSGISWSCTVLLY
jgi:hypothetical protein